ncbi:MAG: hypothetical protein OEZ65_00585 [Gemmatimonadota bacterium]|nr:hypothetical protein [Gemmatimonadota bacterium]MDH5758050.1 hypothetical protein [Gemmatimonadota bacterium]
MPLCSYVVIPRFGQKEKLGAALSSMEGCEVLPAANADLLLLVTDTDSLDTDAELRARVEGLPDIQALVMTFGEIDPDTPEGDPAGASRRRSLPVIEPGVAPAPRKRNRTNV